MSADTFSVQSRLWANLPLRFKGLAVIAIPLVPLFVLAALVTSSTARERAAQADVARTLEVKAEIATLYGLIADAETGVRGYLLTRHPDSMQVIRDTAGPLQRTYIRVRELLQDEIQRQHLGRMTELSRARPLNALLDFARKNPATVAPPSELLAESRATMAQLRDVLRLMQAREDQLLAEHVEQARLARERLKDITLGSVGLGGVASLLAALAFTNGIARRIQGLRVNADRLAHGETPGFVSDARDELGHLGRGLGDASALLQQRERELTERLRDLEETRGELNQFFALSLDLLCIASLDGRFTRVNRAWESVLGWTAEELTATPFVDFVHPDDLASTVAETSALANGAVTVGFENRYRHKNGSYRWLSWKATADLERGVIYAAARDVTDQKNAANEQKHRLAELAALNQELEAFSYSVSHDLRSPLRHITGFAALLEERARPVLDGQAQRHLTTIKDAASRMGRLIDDLLAFSKMGRANLSRRDVDLNAMIADVRRELDASLDRREVRWTVHPLPNVIGDTAMLRLVVMNLLSNAVKYTRTREHPEIEVGTVAGEPGEAVIFVRDNGVGFDMQYAHKLFGVFQRLHRTEEFEGTGIGLANVRRIVHRHGGRVWADAAVNNGATFYVALPLEEGVANDGRAA